ncbi:MAG TPA: hypothetical protein PLR07_11985, partial [Promineifilum sp.]|nr:hypothetical protein [Promineifilum sp.]
MDEGVGCGVAVTMIGGGSFVGGSAVGIRVGVWVGASAAGVAVTIAIVGTAVATGIDGSAEKAINRRSPSARVLPRP